MLRILRALSSLLLIVTAFAWIRSVWVCDLWEFNRPRWSIFIETAGGQFRFEHSRAYDERHWSPTPGFKHDTDKADGPLEDGMRMPGSYQYFRAAHFWLVTGERWGDYHYALFLPAWFVCSVFAFPSMLCVLRKIRSRSMVPAGMCAFCGYDLRATPHRCPECGMPANSGAGRTD
jgi:hypothetical protein